MWGSVAFVFCEIFFFYCFYKLNAQIAGAIAKFEMHPLRQIFFDKLKAQNASQSLRPIFFDKFEASSAGLCSSVAAENSATENIAAEKNRDIAEEQKFLAPSMNIIFVRLKFNVF